MRKLLFGKYIFSLALVLISSAKSSELNLCSDLFLQGIVQSPNEVFRRNRSSSLSEDIRETLGRDRLSRYNEIVAGPRFGSNHGIDEPVKMTNDFGLYKANDIMITGPKHYPLEIITRNLGLTDAVLSKIHPGAKILSVGEGMSDLVPFLSHRFRNTRGLDIWYGQKDLPGELSQYVARNEPYLLSGSSTKIPLPDNSIDLVLSHQLVNNLKSDSDINKTISEMVRVLRPGGEARIAYCCMTIENFMKQFESSMTFESHGWHSKWRYSDREISLEGDLIILRKKKK